MTPHRQANYYSHDGKSPALQQRGYHHAADTKLTRIIPSAREDSLMRCILSQRDTCDTSSEIDFNRTITTFSRVGCSNQNATFLASSSRSIGIISSRVQMPRSSQMNPECGCDHRDACNHHHRNQHSPAGAIDASHEFSVSSVQLRRVGQFQCTEHYRSFVPKRVKLSVRLDGSTTKRSVTSSPTLRQCSGQQTRRRALPMRSASCGESPVLFGPPNAISAGSVTGRAMLSLRSSARSCAVTGCGTRKPFRANDRRVA